ncbi:hypothetical protein GCM10010393_60960 [Streptomyces gobitricini]|uniref:Uncharacterized protein n=1 Tax=Streptomyces gobitricini TaxID=68211 RepID=A0ABN3NE23_9ACTN
MAVSGSALRALLDRFLRGRPGRGPGGDTDTAAALDQGGDTDTVAAVTGMPAGAMYGAGAVPARAGRRSRRAASAPGASARGIGSGARRRSALHVRAPARSRRPRAARTGTGRAGRGPRGRARAVITPRARPVAPGRALGAYVGGRQPTEL